MIQSARSAVSENPATCWVQHVGSEGTLTDLSGQMIDMLDEPYFGRKEAGFHYRHPESVNELALGCLVAKLAGIAFYVPMIAFNDRKKYFPKAELH